MAVCANSINSHMYVYKCLCMYEESLRMTCGKLTIWPLCANSINSQLPPIPIARSTEWSLGIKKSCMCVESYAYTHTCTYTLTYMHTNACAFIYICIRTHMHDTHMHRHTYAHTHICMQKHMHEYILPRYKVHTS